jgi:hypothetical protein
MNKHLQPIRRMVTGDDAKGNSRIVEDAPASAVRNVAGRPGYRAVNIWTSTHQGILPPRNGTILRIIASPSS